MLKSLYSGVSGMKGFQAKLDVIGNNVANANTVGFKKSRVMFQDILNQNVAGATAPTDTPTGGVNSKQIGLGVKVGSIDTIHTPGSPMTTNVGTDLAIDGEAYFVVSPSGDGNGPFYLTKAGNFTRDANGNLVNSNGYFVLDSDKNPINISSEEYSSYSIDSNGKVTAIKKEDGSIDDTLPTIGTAIVSNPGGLEKVGNTLFRVTTNSGDPFNDNGGAFGAINDDTVKGGQINSGVLEMSNVDLTEEFTEMIVAQRGFQANARTITTSDSMLEEIVNLKR